MTAKELNTHLESIPFISKGMLIDLFYDTLDENNQRVFTKVKKTYRNCLDSNKPKSKFTKKELKFVKAKIYHVITTLNKFYLKTLTAKEAKSFAKETVHPLNN